MLTVLSFDRNVMGGNMEKTIIVKKQKLRKGNSGSSEFQSSDIKKSIEKNKKSLSDKQRNRSSTEFIELE